MEKGFFPDPNDTGKDYRLPVNMKPLEKHKRGFSVLTGLTNNQSHDAHSGCATFLTSADTRRVPGKLFQNDSSIDQIAAKGLGQKSRYESISLTSARSAGPASGWGAGRSMSWDESGNPVPGLSHPVSVFNHMFGSPELSTEGRIRQLKEKRSILDSLNSDLGRLKKRLTKSDRDKLEEYAHAIRSVEKQLSRNQKWIKTPFSKATIERPGKEELCGSTTEIKLTYDLMVAGMQADVSRVFSYRQSADGILKEINYDSHIHSLNHARGDKDGRYRSARDVKQLECLSYFFDKLKSVRETDGSTLFDNTLIVYGCGIRHGHGIRKLPVIVAGHGGKQVEHVGHLKSPSNTPLANLWLSVLHHVGVRDKSFADSSGALKGFLETT